MTHADAPIDLTPIVKAYDIRGVAYEQFTPEAAEALGAAFSDLLDAGDLVVAHDMRVSSPELAEAFTRGAVRRGSTVAFAGLSSTDQLYCASGLYNAAGAQFTASHNPAPDNGIKMCFAGARPVGRDSGLLTVRDTAQAYLNAGEIPERPGGRREDVDTLSDYVTTVLDLVPVPGERPLTIVVDAANAMAAHTMPAIAKRLANITVKELYFELDGTFPNHEANPLDAANLADLQAAVLEHGADLGLAFDGDADRCIIVDETGQIVPPSAVTALIAASEIARAQASGEEHPAVVANLVSSRHVPNVIEKAGGRHIRSRVGHSLIKAIMAKENAVFGGEHSAHYYFRDFYYADSGMLAALHVLRALANSGGTLSELVGEYDPFFASGEINSRVDSVAEATERVLTHVAGYGVETDNLDGVTVTHWREDMPAAERWWFSLRPSNTEPLLRLNVEAEVDTTMERMRDELLAVIRGEGADAPPASDWVLDRLRCPACGGTLERRTYALTCTEDGTRYEVADGIPMLIVPDAR